MKTFRAYVVMTNGFALNHDKSLQIYFVCVKGQAEKIKQKKKLCERCRKHSNGLQSNLDGSNTDGSFTMANSNPFWVRTKFLR